MILAPPTRMLALAALLALALACGAAPAPAQDGPDPGDVARNLQGRDCWKLSQTAETLRALTELLRRTQSPGNYLPVQVAAAAAELRTFRSIAQRPGVRSIDVVPSEAGQRSVDGVVRMERGGGLQDTRLEIKTATGRLLGIQPRGGGGRGVVGRAVGMSDIRRAIRSGLSSPGRPAQLEVDLRVNGRVIPAGGTLAVHVRQGILTPTAIEDALRSLAPRLRGATYVHEIEFHGRDASGRWIVERYVRDADGAYNRADPPDGEPPDDPPDGDGPPDCDGPGPRPRPTFPRPTPVDATRGAIAAAADEPRSAASIPGSGTSAARSILAPAGAGTASTGAALDSTLGGVDFSTVELRYLTDVSSERTRAVGFGFTAKRGTGGGALRVPGRASDAFFTWLALAPETFTVNLNPSEPDRIVDTDLGRTYAGRVLLEADLRMKRTTARLIHPDGALGRRYWSEIERNAAGGPICVGFRQWIVPARATVYASDRELYIIKAPLSVKLESEYLRQRGMGSAQRGCSGVDPRVAARSEALFRRLVLPRVQRAVRRAPEYADLRRVYFSRVAAEWYRERAGRLGGAFADIVDSGDVGPWTQRRSWRPRDVFRRYVRSYKRGEFNIKRRSREGNYVVERTYVFGGVDFTSVPRREISRTRLEAMRPGIARRVARAFSRPTADEATGTIWLAGASFDRAKAAADRAFRRPAPAPAPPPATGRPAADAAGERSGGGVPTAVLVVVLALVALAGLAWARRRAAGR